MDDARAAVDAKSVNLLAEHAPTDPVGGFQHHDATAVARAPRSQRPGGRQTSRASSHDHDLRAADSRVWFRVTQGMTMTMTMAMEKAITEIGDILLFTTGSLI